MLTWLVSFLCAGIPSIVVFALVSTAYGYLLGSLAYVGTTVIVGIGIKEGFLLEGKRHDRH